MIIALLAIAALILIAVVYLKKFMDDMAKVESELISELRSIKGVLVKISEKQL
jgi:flagellar biogenesis protein FliO